MDLDLPLARQHTSQYWPQSHTRSLKAQVRLCVLGASSSPASRAASLGATGFQGNAIGLVPFFPHSHPQPWKITNTQPAKSCPCVAQLGIQVKHGIQISYEYVPMLGTSCRLGSTFKNKTKYNV